MIPYAKGAQPNDDEFTAIPAKDVAWHHRILLNRPSKVALIGLIFSVLGPILIYVYIMYPSEDFLSPDGFSIGSCLVPRPSRIPCGSSNVTETDCDSQCCFDYEIRTCFHRFPSRFTYISFDGYIENGTLTPRVQNSPFKSQANIDIKISVDEISNSHLALTFYDAKENTIEGNKREEKDYVYHLSTPELNVVVNDTSDNIIFNTVRGPIIAADNIWEIVFKVSDEVMYGLGDIPLREGTVKVLYNHDDSWNGMPVIFSKSNGTFHGLLIDVIEPTELTVIGNNQIILRSLAKRAIKLHLFTGPKPKDIMKDVMKMTGPKPALEYWMLGLHICSDITDSSTYEGLEEFLRQATTDNMPFESHCGVKPIVFQNDNCDNTEEITKGAALVKSFNKYFIPHISPYIHTNEPKENSSEVLQSGDNCLNIVDNYQEIMLKTSNNSLYEGVVGNDTVVYPDYEFSDEGFMKKLWNVSDIDGLLLENTWPLDQSSKNHNKTYNILPYFSQYIKRAFDHTPQWDITRLNGELFMYTHNQYGGNFADAFRRNFNNVPIWVTSQRFGRHIVNRQDVTTSWFNLQRILTETALGGISGNGLWSTPVCGDTAQYDNNIHTHLCLKWYQASTYLPLIRVHSKQTPRHPLSFAGNNKANIITALNNRLSLLPYFYMTLQEGPLLRPMFYQFPSVEALSNLTSQFSVGEDLVIVPNLLPSQSHVHFHVPPGKWFELWSGLPLEAGEDDVVTMTTTDADFLVVVSGGAILIMQKNTESTAEATRLNSDYTLTIALSDNTDSIATTNHENLKKYQAEGKLYINENMTVIFKANGTSLAITSEGDEFKALCDITEAVWARKVTEINVFGLDELYNNYDHLKRVRVNLDLCLLENQEEIVFNFIT